MKTCPKCQQSNLPDNTGYCTNCGYDFLHLGTLSLGPKKTTPRNSIFAAILAIGVSVIILILMSTSNHVSTEQFPVFTNTPRHVTIIVTATHRAPVATARKSSTSTVRVVSPSKTPIAIPTTKKSYVTISCAENISQAALRKSPGYASKDDAVDIIYKIDCGQQLLLLGDSQYADGLRWWKVSWNGYVGWMAGHTGSGRTILVFD